MNENNRVRQVHRWVSIAFTVTVAVCFISLGQEKPAAWVFYVPLLPLALLTITGLYLFVLPHAARRRRRRHAGGQNRSA